MADSIVKLSVEDSSFNSKIKEAAKSFARFGSAVAKAGVDSFGKFARGAETAKVAFEGFNKVLKANAIMFVASLAIEAGQAIAEMIGKWISGADDAEAAQKRLNDELERTADIVNNILAESDFNARIAKAAGKSTSEILQMKYQAADAAYNQAMATLFDPKIKVGSDEYNKAREIFDKAEKARTKAWQDIQVDETAKQHHTGEYAIRGGGRRSTNNVSAEERNLQRMMADFQRKMQEGQRLVAELRAKEHQTETIGLSGFNQKTMSAWMQGRQNDLAGAEFGSVDYNTIMQNIADMQAIKTIMEERLKAGLQATDAEGVMESYWERVFDGENIPDSTWQSLIDAINEHLKEIGQDPIELDFTTGKASKSNKDKKSENGLEQLNKFNGDYSKVVGGVSSIASGIQQMGVEIPKEIQSVIGVLSGISSIITGVSAILSLILMEQQTQTITSIIDTIKPFAQGGVVRAAGGTVVGNTYSGDQIPALLNAGEVVLSRSQVSNLASTLQGQNGGGINIVGELQGEKIVLVANRFLKRSGQGELVTW